MLYFVKSEYKLKGFSGLVSFQGTYCVVTVGSSLIYTPFNIFQEANKRSNNWLPPPWAMVALVVLGFNEFMTLLR